MEIFLTLFTNLLPLYALIALGFIAGRYFGVERLSLANLAIYTIVPVVIFGFIAKLELQPEYLLLPIIIYALHAALGIIFYRLSPKIYPDKRANLLTIISTSGNHGYFGLPLVMLLFTEQWIAVYMFIILGAVIWEITGTYYIACRGQFSARDSLKRLAKFPTIYAVIFGLLFNVLGGDLSPMAEQYWTYFRGCYIVIGMMIIGCALGKIDRLVIAPKFITLSFAAKFIIWPLISWAFVLLDAFVLKLFPEDVHQLIMVAAIVPFAANISAFATQLNLDPEKAATTILLGTIFALLYIPLFLAFFNMR